MTRQENFQKKVYDLCSQIPSGKASTYKIIAQVAYNSPNYARWVGNLLSHCPYCKYISNDQNYSCSKIHCYRVIKSNFYSGGLKGKREGWKEKIKKLSNEKIFFDEKGKLLKELRKKVIFDGFQAK